MGANCSSDRYVGCIYYPSECTKHPNRAKGYKLPVFTPGRINCPWGERDPAPDPVDKLTRAIALDTKLTSERRKTEKNDRRRAP